MDDDGSGKISYIELAGMVREELALGLEELPEATIKKVWLALDKDGSGWMTAGEFGAFMRKGQHAINSNRPTWRQKAEAAKRAEADALRARMDSINHQDIKREMKREKSATPEEVRALSQRLSTKLTELIPDRRERSWFKLFKHMDDDSSGLIGYDELAGMVREELLLTPVELPEKDLKRVWLALDKDDSGHINAGEFGAFMRLGMPEEARVAPLERRRQIALGIRATINSETAMRKRTHVVDTQSRCRKANAEADLIEARLAELTGLTSSVSAGTATRTPRSRAGSEPGGAPHTRGLASAYGSGAAKKRSVY
jgi:Ca2+-binding EF-hand superfamily protein